MKKAVVGIALLFTSIFLPFSNLVISVVFVFGFGLLMSDVLNRE